MAKPQSDKELIELGKKLQSFYESGYVNKREALQFSLLKGIVSGLGAAIGSIIIFALLIWLLTFVKHIPGLSPLAQNIRNTVNNSSSR